ncbi:MAG: ABC transporter permease subunit [Slackia sp.]
MRHGHLLLCNFSTIDRKRIIRAALVALCNDSRRHNAFAAAHSYCYALEVESCTASPNEDGGDRILCDTPTRVTWRAHANESESLSKVTLTFPEGVEFNADKAKVTGLSGLDRVELNAEVTSPGDGTLVISMPEGAPAGVSFLVEIYNVVFPGDGGEFQVAASTESVDGQSVDLGPQGSVISVAGISTAEQIAAWLNNQAWVQAWNTNKFLHLFFDPAIIVTSIPSVFNGWLTALGIVAVSFPCAIPVGFVLALMRMARFRVLRALAATFVNVVRGTDVLQIYIAFFGLPLLGLNVNNFVLGCCVMALNSSAYLCEIFRAGIQSISKASSKPLFSRHEQRPDDDSRHRPSGIPPRHPHHDQRTHPAL